MKYIIIDVVIAAVLLFTVWRGWKKGFVLTLCGLLAVFVAFIGANYLSQTFAEPVGDWLRPAIEERLNGVIRDAVDGQPSVDVSLPEGAAPELSLDELLNGIRDSKLYKALADWIGDAVDKGVLEGTSNAAKAVSSYLALQLARAALFVLAFLLILLLWFLLSHALDLAFKLPVLSTLNQFGGGALGLLKGGLLVFIAAWLLGGFIPAEAVKETYLLKFFCTVSPLTLIAGFLQPK